MKNKKGSSYITVITATSVFFVFFSILSIYYVSQVKKVNTQENRITSYYLSESGIADAVSYIYQNLNYHTYSNLSQSNSSIEQLSNLEDPYFVTDEKDRVMTEPNSNTIYIEGYVQNHQLPVQVEQINGLKNAIENLKQFYVNSIQNEIESYKNQSVECQNCSVSKLNTMINNSQKNPPVILIKNFSLPAGTTTLGSINKPSILLFDNLSVDSNSTLNIYGNFITPGGFNINQPITLNVKKVNNNYGNIYVNGHFNVNGASSNIQAENNIYAESWNLNHSAFIMANYIVVNRDLHASNSSTSFNIKKDLIVGGDLIINQTASIVANGDVIVQKNVSINSSLQLVAQGSVAVGGNITSNTPPSINTGGNSTSLIFGQKPGEGNGDFKKYTRCISEHDFLNRYGTNKDTQLCEYIFVYQNNFVPFPEYKQSNHVEYTINQIKNTNYYDIFITSYYGKTKVEIECRIEYNKDNSIEILFYNQV